MGDETVVPFEAEVDRVLDIVINSLYQHREIFLRELISNAADACDRLRYAAIAEPGLLGDDPQLRIEVALDPAAGTLTVRDNGVGMGRDELAENLGTIARSGTARFVQTLSGDAARDVSLIGRFGVGFYSAFMVAEEVAVLSRKAGESHAWRWRSDGRRGYAIGEAEEAAPRGTAVILKLRDDAKEFLDPSNVRGIVRRYSDHVPFPIMLRRPADKAGEAPPEPEQVNAASALWTRPKSGITDEQYREFYHHVAHAFDDPWARLHFTVEGVLSYTALLFVPGMRPFDLYDPARRHGVKLYVKRVFVADDVEGLLPRYLRFVAGVIDSDDLELNVSRETLQHSPVVARMRSGLVRRVLDELDRRAKAGDGGYDAFWDNFGAVLKEGIYEDADHRARLLELARFRSTRDEGWVSLADYKGRMREGQDAIFYISGESLDALKHSPLLEACRAKGVEVLLLDDAVDEFWIPAAGEYAGTPLRSLTRGGVDLSKIKAADGEGADRPEEPRLEGGELDRLIAAFKGRLGDAVGDVRPSERLTESAVCLVADEHGPDLRLERFLRQHNQLGGLPSARVLEVNPRHPLIRRLAEMAGDEGRREAVGEIVDLLLDQARIVEGEPLPDPGAFSRRMSAVLAKGLAAA